MVTKIWLQTFPKDEAGQKIKYSQTPVRPKQEQLKFPQWTVSALNIHLFTDAIKQFLSIPSNFLLFNLALSNSTLFMHNTECFYNINKNVLW